MTADWTGCFLLTCVTVSSVQRTLHTKLTQQVAVNTRVECLNQTRANKHTRTCSKCTHLCIHTYTHRSTRITVRGVSASWLTEQSTYMCQQFPFTWGQSRGEEEKKKKMMGKIPIVYLYETSFPREREQKGKKSFISFCIVEMIDLLSQ